MAIAKQAPQSAGDEGMQPQSNSDKTESESSPDDQDSGEWLPPDIGYEENPLATGAWLPAKDPPPQHTPVPSRWLPAKDPPPQHTPVPSRWLPAEPEAKRVLRDSWLPPELLTESEREASAAALPPSLAPEPVTAPAPPPVAAPAEEPVTAPEPQPETAPETAVEFKPADQRDETADYGRRTRAVNAYCRELFATTRAPGVADHILDSLSGGISEDVALLEVTRTSAAKRLTEARPADNEPTECTATPGRLAARANGTLEASERDRLERHLASCIVCMAAERRVTRADMAFAAVLGLKSSEH